MIRRIVAVTVVTVAALTLTGCSTQTEAEPGPQGAAPTASTTDDQEAPETVLTRIPRSTLETFFPISRTATTVKWLSTPGQGNRLERRLPPCDKAKTPLRIDRHVNGFAQAVFEDDGYLVSRQLTLYPDSETAQKFVAQMQQTPTRCARVRGSDQVGDMTRADYRPDRGFGIRGGDAVFSEGTIRAGKKGEHSFAWTDVVSTRENAVMLTRIGEFGEPTGDATAKDENRRFVQQVRAHGTEGLAILDTLR